MAQAIEPTTAIAMIVPLPHQAVRIGSNAALWLGDKRFTGWTNVPDPMLASASARQTCRWF
jgi:hypothetical protein